MVGNTNSSSGDILTYVDETVSVSLAPNTWGRADITTQLLAGYRRLAIVIWTASSAELRNCPFAPYSIDNGNRVGIYNITNTTLTGTVTVRTWLAKISAIKT